MSEPGRIEFRYGDADLHAMQARLAGIDAGGGTQERRRSLGYNLVDSRPPSRSALVPVLRRDRRDAARTD